MVSAIAGFSLGGLLISALCCAKNFPSVSRFVGAHGPNATTPVYTSVVTNIFHTFCQYFLYTPRRPYILIIRSETEGYSSCRYRGPIDAGGFYEGKESSQQRRSIIDEKRAGRRVTGRTKRNVSQYAAFYRQTYRLRLYLYGGES